MKHLRTTVLLWLGLALAGCGPSYAGTFVDPPGSAWVTIRDKGEIVNAAGDQLKYTVVETTPEGTTLDVTDGADWHARWRITPDGQELHGASSPAKVVFRRK